MLYTINFKRIVSKESDVPPEIVKEKYYDSRNDIVCYGPSMDIQCYLNYIELLNGLRKGNDSTPGWVNFGYLDLGMMPLVMAPSFLQSELLKTFSEMKNVSEIKAYFMPPVSLLKGECKLPDKDVWVFKEDVARVFKKDVKDVCFSNFIRWCMA